MKLGKKPYVPSHKDLLYKNYRTSSLPPVPTSFGHQNFVSNWGMLANDSLGDCVIAGSDHSIMLWCAEGGKAAIFTDANAISDYSAACGYVPGQPNTDQGCEIRSVLGYMQTTGMVDAANYRHKIGAYLALDQTNFAEVLEAAYLFGSVKIGINFPESAMTQFNAGQPWTVVPGSLIEGGHDVEITGFDGTWLNVITWGKNQQVSPEFFQTYCDEAWAQLSQEMLNGQGVSPEGFNLAQLQADLAALSSVPPTPVPTPTPPTPVQGNYVLTVKFPDPSPEDGTWDNAVIETMNGTTSVAGQTVTNRIKRSGQIYTPTSLTDANGQAVLKIESTTEEDVVIISTWIAPDGKSYEATAEAKWQKPTPVPPTPPAPTLTSISVTPSAANLQVGKTQAETVMATYSDGSTANVTSQTSWTSLNTGIATISASGTVNAISAGSTAINASFGGKSASVNVVVAAAPTPPVPVKTYLVLYFGDADLQIAADLAQYYQCPIIQAAYATATLIANATTAYQVGGSTAPAGVTLLAGADRFATMKAVLQAMGKD